MNPPDEPGRRDADGDDAELVRFTLQALPGDTVFPGRERKGRPARPQSVPPRADEPASPGGPPAG